jgi:hypothetical protein
MDFFEAHVSWVAQFISAADFKWVFYAIILGIGELLVIKGSKLLETLNGFEGKGG